MLIMRIFKNPSQHISSAYILKFPRYGTRARESVRALVTRVRGDSEMGKVRRRTQSLPETREKACSEPPKVVTQRQSMF